MTGIARHMRRKLPGHGWSREKAHCAANLLGIRKRRIVDGTQLRHIRQHKKCPVKGCYALVTRLDKHLRKMHGRTCKTSDGIINTTADDEAVNNDLLGSFLKWGQSGDGGCLSERTVTRQVDQLKRLTHLQNLSSSLYLANDEPKLNSFIAERIDKGWSCRTASSYIFSVISLSNYIRSRHFEAWFTANSVDLPFEMANLKTNAASTAEAGRRWCKSYAKKGRADVHAREENVRETLVTPEEAKICHCGPVSENVRKLRQRHHLKPLTEDEMRSGEAFILVRDFIVLNLLIFNGHRSAIVYELSCEEFSRARQVGKKYLLKCKRHKTEGNYGAGDIIVRLSLYDVMQFYFETLRPFFDTKNCSKFFISKNGTAFSSSQVAAAAQSAWNKNGLDKAKKITPNVTRRSAATRVYEFDPSLSSDAASLMLHSLKVHRRHYTKMDKEGAAFRGEATIHEAYHVSDSDDESGQRPPSPSTCERAEVSPNRDEDLTEDFSRNDKFPNKEIDHEVQAHHEFPNQEIDHGIQTDHEFHDESDNVFSDE